MRILYLSQWFEPEPAFKGMTFVKELVRLGHEVQVLTGFPNYPEGRLYEGYKLRLWQREMMEDIPVTRVWLYPSHDRSSLRRIANYLSFALMAGLLGPWLMKPADVVYVYHPPGTVGWPAVALRLWRRLPFVYDIMDLWPDSVTGSGMMNSRVVHRLLDAWCRFVYKCAGRIVAVTPGFKEILCSRGVPAEKIEIIYNWSNDALLESTAPDTDLAQELGLAGHFNVVFAGNMGPAQALDTVLAAATLLAERSPDVQFVLVGAGIDVERLKQLQAEMNLTNVLFLPRRPPSEIGTVLNLADVLLVHLRDDPLFRITIPSKTQAYMAAGKPILMAVRGDSATLVAQAGAGVVCDPENPAAMAEAVTDLASQTPKELHAMGERGRRFYQEELSLVKGVRRFEAVLRKVAETR